MVPSSTQRATPAALVTEPQIASRRVTAPRALEQGSHQNLQANDRFCWNGALHSAQATASLSSQRVTAAAIYDVFHRFDRAFEIIRGFTGLTPISNFFSVFSAYNELVAKALIENPQIDEVHQAERNLIRQLADAVLQLIEQRLPSAADNVYLLRLGSIDIEWRLAAISREGEKLAELQVDVAHSSSPHRPTLRRHVDEALGVWHAHLRLFSSLKHVHAALWLPMALCLPQVVDFTAATCGRSWWTPLPERLASLDLHLRQTVESVERLCREEAHGSTNFLPHRHRLARASLPEWTTSRRSSSGDSLRSSRQPWQAATVARPTPLTETARTSPAPPGASVSHRFPHFQQPWPQLPPIRSTRHPSVMPSEASAMPLRRHRGSSPSNYRVSLQKRLRRD